MRFSQLCGISTDLSSTKPWNEITRHGAIGPLSLFNRTNHAERISITYLIKKKEKFLGGIKITLNVSNGGKSSLVCFSDSQFSFIIFVGPMECLLIFVPKPAPPQAL